ncbi:hypothetical protein [Anabaena azotica]|uniref:hypothetical protein n=1 Tax=Anabaena azotica TaxID=197653 RepID=UPI0039A5DA90
MADKSLEALVVKVVKKVIKKEIKAINQYNLPIVSTPINQELQNFTETLETEDHTQTAAEMFDDIYASNTVNFPTKEDVELDRKLREMKFKQDLRKDWILFLLRDVIVYAVTVLFIFTVSGFYLFAIINT